MTAIKPFLHLTSHLIKASFTLAVAGAVAVPICKGVIWAGKKIVTISEDPSMSQWKQTALKITGKMLSGFGLTLGVSFALLVGLSSATSWGVMGVGIAIWIAPPVIGPALCVTGLALGILGGCIAGQIALESVLDSFSDKKEVIEFA